MTEIRESDLSASETAVLRLGRLYRMFGYKRYRVAKFEEYDLYSENKSFLPERGILTFTDTDGRLRALKPDITLSIVKNAAGSGERLRKVFYHESVYRASGGGFRETGQTGLECIGEVDGYTTLETVYLAYKSLAEIGGDFLLDLSHIGYVGGLLRAFDVGGEAGGRLLSALSRKDAGELAAVCREWRLPDELAGELAALARVYGTPDEVLPVLERGVRNPAMGEAVSELRGICEALGRVGDFPNLRLDFSVVNDMAYYSGVIFRGYLRGVPRGVLSGGRYDGLARKMGAGSGAVGFAVYLDALESHTPEEEPGTAVRYSASDDPGEVLRRAADIVNGGGGVRVRREEGGSL